MTQVREWAQRYAAVGLPVFPVRSDKTPMVSGGLKASTLETDRIDAWWGTWPGAGIGVAVPKDLIVLDVDPGGEMALDSHGLSVPATVTSVTGRNGRHYWYKVPESHLGKVQNGTAILGSGSGVDVRTVGGYCVVPPSIHENGNPYTWSVPPIEGNFAEAPDWLLEKAAKPEVSPNLLDEARSLDIDAIMAGVSEGGRDQRLFKLSASLRSKGIPRNMAEELVLLAASRCSPPFPPREALKKVASAYDRYEGGELRAPGDYRPARATASPLIEPGKTWTMDELLSTEFADADWIVEPILSVGLSIVVAPAKSGKSYLLGNVMTSVACGTKALGGFATPRAKVLYLDLEQTPRRAKRRWEQIFGGIHAPNFLETKYTFPRMDLGGMEHLDRLLSDDKDLRVVVIDTWGKFNPDFSKLNGNAYYQEYAALEPLAALAHKHRACIVLVHHTRKSEMVGDDPLSLISGSAAMSGVPDNIWVMFRNRQENAGRLFVTGKEVEDAWINMNWFPQAGAWMVASPEKYDPSMGIVQPPTIYSPVHKAQVSIGIERLAQQIQSGEIPV